MFRIARPIHKNLVYNREVKKKAQRTNPWTAILWTMLIAVTGLFLYNHFVRRPDFYAIDHTYQYIPSPNHNLRTPWTTIDCVVLHSTADSSLASTVAEFATHGTGRSAHFVVAKNGHVVQMVPIEYRAWHAGRSCLDGDDNVNDFSVGIEMVNLDNGRDPYTKAQYKAVAGIILLLRTRCNIPDSRIVSHAKVALPPGRKCDPLGFNFQRLYRMLDNAPYF
jgi:N-acetylmuramoyl-L-alanine amidase